MFQFRFSNKVILLFSLLFIFSFYACGDDDEPTPTPVVTYGAELKNITNNVIIPTYTDLANKAVILLSEVQNLAANPNATRLNKARGAWRDARVPWESSEGFLFGPVDTKGIDPAIDDWPVNEIDLDAVLSSSDNLTELYIDGLETGLKGFHTIEYLLWGVDGSKEVGAFTAREFEYLISTTENLKNKTKILSDSWAVSGEDYGSNVINAGTSGSLFISQKAILEQLVEAVAGIADEVGAGKIADPLGDTSPDPTKEESRFSHNSKNDFANNIRSISNVYNGSYVVGSGGLADIINEKDSGLNQRVQDAIVAAIDAIQNISGNFTDAISNNRPAVENAKNKVLELKQILDGEVATFISGL